MECPHLPLISLSEFTDRLNIHSQNSRIPISGSIEVTERCNLHCVHCYINLPAGDRQTQERELTFSELCNILDQIVDEGCLWLLLTGGEPFIRPDFLDIYTYAKKKGIIITLFTNGTTITPRIADYLSEWHPFSIEITLYGSTKKTFEMVTGVHGSYELFMKGIDLLMERKLPLKLKTMVLTLNKHELRDMKRFAEGLGIEFRFDPILNLRLDGDKRPSNFRITPKEVVELDLADEKRVNEWHEFCNKFSGIPVKEEYIYQCGAGNVSFHIDPYGNLSACMMARFPNFNLRSGTFKEGWNKFMQTVITQKWSKEIHCKGCELISLCGQCPGWAYIEHGDQERPVDYLCQIAHFRTEFYEFNTVMKGVKNERKG